MSKLIEEAKAFALAAHGGIFRPNKAHEPYSVHLEETAKLVENSGGSEEEIATAWLHDCLEDTSVSIKEIYERFGLKVGLNVEEVTDQIWPADISTFRRKQIQAERIRRESVSAKRVKLADQTSNVGSVAVDPPVDWTYEKCRDYVEGAKLIAIECQGISSWLDDRFMEAYSRAKNAHDF